jgi:hypothetical protein
MSKRSDWINGELADLVFLNFKAILKLVWAARKFARHNYAD